MKKITDIYIFFIEMFPKIFFNNEIVKNIIDIVGQKTSILNDKVDKTLNEDI